MAHHDPLNDITPVLTVQNVMLGKFPTIAALKAAISGSGVSASYPAAAMQTMTKNDLIFICKSHAIACVGL